MGEVNLTRTKFVAKGIKFNLETAIVIAIIKMLKMVIHWHLLRASLVLEYPILKHYFHLQVQYSLILFYRLERDLTKFSITQLSGDAVLNKNHQNLFLNITTTK